MTLRPRVQISGEADHLVNYVSAVLRAGGDPVAGWAPAPDLSCDGLLLAGGGDLDPALFHQPDRGSHPPDPVRDAAELRLTEAFLAAGRPVFGICRGLQVISVVLGGTLIQDLPPHLRLFHAWDGEDRIHPVRAERDSLLGRTLGELFLANSAHHQALDDPGEGMVVTAWSEGGVPEGAEHRSLPVFGTQFHPEHFLSLCRS